MKRISIFVVLVLLLALTACSRDPAQSKPSDASQEPRAARARICLIMCESDALCLSG